MDDGTHILMKYKLYGCNARNVINKYRLVIKIKLSYKTAAKEPDLQAGDSLKGLNQSLVKGIGLFSSGKEDIKDDSFLSEGDSTEKKIRRK
uniref:Uncharacterized protein n=1 Tax=Romanomermis culicivorax TaxID=13658 RepID=A0A915HWX6_ROMCU